MVANCNKETGKILGGSHGTPKERRTNERREAKHPFPTVSVASGNLSHTYAYHPGTGIVKTLAHKSGAATIANQMLRTKLTSCLISKFSS